MKHPIAKRRAAEPDLPGFARVLPEIRSLIDASRQHVVSTANLTLVWLYWNVGRIITQDIQKNQKRAGYGEQLLRGLAEVLIRQYGSGYSQSNLNDMRRFFEGFEILQPAAVKSGSPVLPVFGGELASVNILQPVAVKSEDRLTIDLGKHHHLGWTHYRILLAVEAGLKRGFYFQQAATHRWSKRELQRQIDRALFERVALSRDTRALVRLEK
jgi:hypothetical protein